MNGPSLQDRAEIEVLYTRYMWALDTGDPEGNGILSPGKSGIWPQWLRPERDTHGLPGLTGARAVTR